jgi:hypothetical protein
VKSLPQYLHPVAISFPPASAMLKALRAGVTFSYKRKVDPEIHQKKTTKLILKNG